MEELFNFEEIDGEKVVGGGNAQKYIYPGVRHNVIIKDVGQGQTPNGTPFVSIEFFTKEGGPETAKEFRFWMSERAKTISLQKLKHIATKVAKLDEVNAVKSLDEWRDLLKGRALRIQFNGEEYENANGEIKEKATIGLVPFAEAIEDDAEYPAVSDEDTKLAFDKENKYQMKRLPSKATEAPSSNSDTPTNKDGVDW